MDAVLEQDRERRRPIPPPISEEHAAMRERIEREEGRLRARVARALEGKDLDEAVREDPELTLHAAFEEDPELLDAFARQSAEMRKERDFLASQGVDPRPYERHEPKF